MSAATLAALRAVWREELPITTALGIEVAESLRSGLVLRMPLAPNRNHKGTAFAGSLSALATLAGWSLLWLALRESGDEAHVVIQDASIRYLLPVHTDALATAEAPHPAELERLLTTLRRRGRARIAVTVTVRDTAGAVVAVMEGRYVVGGHR